MKFSLTIQSDSAEEIAKFLMGTETHVNMDAPININFGASNAPTIATVETTEENEPVNAVAPDRDSSGLPWDERIHSKAKSQNADGTWRRKKGVNDDVFNAVVAELRSNGTAPAPTQPEPAAASPQAAQPQHPTQPAIDPSQYFGTPVPGPDYAPQPAIQPVAMPAQMPNGNGGYTQTMEHPPQAAQPQAPVQQAPQTAPAAAPVMGFGDLMTAISGALRDQKIDQTYIAKIVQENLNGEALTTLATTNAAQLPAVVARMRQDGKI